MIESSEMETKETKDCRAEYEGRHINVEKDRETMKRSERETGDRGVEAGAKVETAIMEAHIGIKECHEKRGGKTCFIT